MNCTQDLYYCLPSSRIFFQICSGQSACSILLGARRSAHSAWRTAHEFFAFEFITTRPFCIQSFSLFQFFHSIFCVQNFCFSQDKARAILFRIIWTRKTCFIFFFTASTDWCGFLSFMPWCCNIYSK
jgi:hypothetical protein